MWYCQYQFEVAMRLLSFTDFALRSLMWLARSPGRHLNTEELSKELGISRNHLQKVVQALAEKDFVVTQRGAKGGVALARSPDRIGIGDVVRWCEQEQPMVDCFREDGGSCSLRSDCRLQGALSGAQRAFYAHLDKLTLADLTES
jgi:Rrf2 family transcriptional regulator, nitric oxide-sensitive transcriptional repressor